MIHEVGHRGILQAPEVMKCHADRIVMRPCVELDELVVFQLNVAVDGHSKNAPKRWHGTDLACWEFVPELSFTGYPDILGSRYEFEVTEIHHSVGRNDCQAQQPIRIHNHGFRHFISGNMDGCGSFRSGVDGGVHPVFVDGLTGIEKLFQSS